MTECLSHEVSRYETEKRHFRNEIKCLSQHNRVARNHEKGDTQIMSINIKR